MPNLSFLHKRSKWNFYFSCKRPKLNLHFPIRVLQEAAELDLQLTSTERCVVCIESPVWNRAISLEFKPKEVILWRDAWVGEPVLSTTILAQKCSVLIVTIMNLHTKHVNPHVITSATLCHVVNATDHDRSSQSALTALIVTRCHAQRLWWLQRCFSCGNYE